MWTKHLSIVFILTTMLLAACRPSLPGGTPAATAGASSSSGSGTSPTGSRPSPTPQDRPIPLPAKTTVLLWHREGGIAGFCDDLSLAADGSYTLINCITVPQTTVSGQLDAGQLKQLARWVNTFRSFAISDGQRAVSPDAMILKTSFTGVGTQAAGPDDRAAIDSFAALLAAQPVPENDGNDPPAILKARDYLARELNIGSDQIDVLSFGFVQWPDRCLGIMVLGEMCAQGVTPGFKVTLQAAGQLYELHTDEPGDSIRQVP